MSSKRIIEHFDLSFSENFCSDMIKRFFFSQMEFRSNDDGDNDNDCITDEIQKSSIEQIKCQTWY